MNAARFLLLMVYMTLKVASWKFWTLLGAAVTRLRRWWKSLRNGVPTRNFRWHPKE